MGETGKKLKTDQLTPLERYLVIIQGLRDGVVFATTSEPNAGRILLANPAFSDITGIPEEQVKGENIFQFMDDLAGPEFPSYAERALSRESLNPFEIEHNGKSLEIIVSSGGERRGIVTTIRDITKRKKAEEALQRKKRTLNQIASHAPDLIYIKDDEHRFVFTNREHADLLGATGLSEVIGKTDFDFHPKELAEKYRRDEESVLQGESLVDITEEVILPSGEKRTFLTTKLPIREEGGKITGIIGVGKDITEMRELEERLRHKHKMEAIGTLAGGIAHDFNNILQAVLGYAALLKLKSESGSDAYKAADIIEQAGMRAAGLTQQILGFARQGKYLNQPVDMHKTICEAVSILGQTIDKRIGKTTRLKADNPYAQGDPSQLQQIIMNLAINASQAMFFGGELTFETRNVTVSEEQSHKGLPPGKYLLVSVEDTGTGIPEEIQERIYEPFFTTKGTEGTGMGLATVYGIVENHHGSIEFDSEIGKGTIFRIYLPVSEEMTPKKAVFAGGQSVQGSGRVLVVDDEDTVRSILSAMLAYLGYDVVCVADGKQAVDYYASHRGIDLVLLDMVMPVMNGRDCFYELKKINPSVKVILSTGQAVDETAQDLMEQGLAGFLQKPYIIGPLSEAITNALRD